MTDPFYLDRDVAMFDLDIFETEAHVVARPESRGVRTVCYLSAGSWEEWCERMLPFIKLGKAVFAAEYTDMEMTTAKFRGQAKALGRRRWRRPGARGLLKEKRRERPEPLPSIFETWELSVN